MRPLLCRTIAGLSALVCVGALAQQATQIKGHEAGQKLYMNYCASCHGNDLDGANAQSLVDGFWQYGGGNGQLRRNIKFGIVSVGMPEYGSAMSNKEINQVIDFMKAAGDQLKVERPPLPEVLHTREYDVAVEEWIPVGQVRAPWGIAFVDAENAFVTEKPGNLRVIQNGKLLPNPVSGTPEVFFKGQGGLLDVAVDPDYRNNGYVYLSYSHRKPGADNEAAMTRIVRGRIKQNAWVDEQVVFEAPHDTYRQANVHYGSRIVFDPDGKLYFSIGDRGGMKDAQNLSKPNGKVHRVNPDGSVPSDNPFVNQSDALPSIYSYGHRNPQGLSVHPETGQVWDAEHGPMGGDEVNLVAAGKNYGWPVISYGVNYNGTLLTEEFKRDDMEQPLYYWAPSIAVCGVDFYGKGQFKRWENNLLVGGLAHEVLSRLVTAEGRVIHEEILLQGQGRVRDVGVGPDGAIYVVHNGPDRILRLTMKERVIRQ